MHARTHRLGRGQRVAGGRELNANAGRRLAVQARRGGVALAAQGDTGHVFQAHGRTIGVGAQHDAAKLLGAAELAVDDDGSRHALASHIGQAADLTG